MSLSGHQASQTGLVSLDGPTLAMGYAWYSGFNLHWGLRRRATTRPARSLRHAVQRICPDYVASWPAAVGLRHDSGWLDRSMLVVAWDGCAWLVGPGYTDQSMAELLGTRETREMDDILAILRDHAVRYEGLVKFLGEAD